MMATRYSAYKHYDTAWLPELPAHWSRSRIKFLATFMVSGGTPPTSVDGYWGGDIAWVSPKDMKTGIITETEDYITPDAIAVSAARMVPARTLLMVVRSGILRHSIPVALAGNNLAINQDIKAIGFSNRILPDFAKYFIEGQQAVLLSRWCKPGTTVESIESEYFANDEMPVPPIVDQSAIVRFLDSETARIDELIDKERRLLELLEEKRLAVITHAVTKGLDPKARMKDSGIDWLGQIPAHWELKRLKYFSAVYDCKHVTPTYIDDGFPLVSTTEVKPFSLAFSAARQVGEDDFSNMTEGGRLPTRDDIIYSRNVSVGSAARVADEVSFCMGQDLCLIRPAHQVRSEFFEFSLNSNAVLGQIDSLTVGATFKRINVERIRNYWIPLPPDDEQHRITLYLKRNIAHLRRVTTAVEMAIQRLVEYRSALITNAVTGKIDVRDLKNKEAAA